MNKQDDNRLTIEEIKHLDKCSDISLKVSLFGSIFAGFSFLVECGTIGLVSISDVSTILKAFAVMLSTTVMGLGFAACEFSHYILKEREKINNMLDDEKYRIYFENQEKGRGK